MPAPTLHPSGELNIDADRCAHTRIARATCQHCVDVCPTQAWHIDEDGLTFDAEHCDRCDLCVAACPHEALSVPAPVAKVCLTPQPQVLMACDHSTHGLSANGANGNHAAGVTTCLHSLSPAWLWDQAQHHKALEFLLLSGSCKQCPRRPEQMLHTRWQAWVDRTQQPSPRLTWATSAQWAAAVQNAKPPESPRRKLLLKLMPSAPGGPAKAANASLTSGRSAAAAHLRGQVRAAPTVPPFWSVTLDGQKCNWCMTCLHLCPKRAFSMTSSKTGDRGLFALDSTLCTGCGLCTDVCDVHALAISEPVGTNHRETSQLWRLGNHVCSACGTRHWRPVDVRTSETDTRCPACLGGKPPKRHRIIDDGASCVAQI